MLSSPWNVKSVRNRLKRSVYKKRVKRNRIKKIEIEIETKR